MKKIVSILLASLILITSLFSICISAYETEQDREYIPKLIIVDRYGEYISLNVYVNENGDVLAPVNTLSVCGGMKSETSKDEYIYYYGNSRNGLRKEICIDKDGKNGSSVVYFSNTTYKTQKSVSFSDSYEINNVLYLPLIELLPFIDGKIEITEDDGILHIYLNPVSLFSALSYGPYDNLASIVYDVDNFWWDYFPGAAGMLIDTIMNWRFDRLDIVTHSGSIKDYTTIFKKLLTDNETYLSAFDKEKNPIQTSLDSWSGPLGDFSDNVGNIVDATDACAKKFKYMVGSKKYYEEYKEFATEIEGLDYAGKMIEGFDKTISYFSAYANQVDDHREMLNAVYGGENYRDTPICNAANEVSLLYGTNTAGQVVAMTSSALRDYLSKVVSGAVTTTFLKPYAIAFDVIKFVFSGENEYVKETALIFKINDIIKDSSTVFNKNFKQLEFTENSLNNTRLSLMMILTASKYAFETYRTSIWEEDEVALKLEQINEWLEKLYLAKDSIECNTSDYYNKTKSELSANLQHLNLYDNTNPDTPNIPDIPDDLTPSEGLKFTLNKDGESYSVTGIGTCEDTKIVIPSKYNGKPVTTIGSSAFYDCDSLTSVVIPDSVTTIGNSAFPDCSNLTSVVIGDSVTTIGNYAFEYCSSLTSVVIPDSVTTIGNHAFEYCSSLTSVVIPDSVTTIGDDAFSNCKSLTSVIIGDSVTTIGHWAFWDCSSLTSVVIPDSVTTIGDGAFYDCDSLTSVVIGDSVTTIGGGAFEYCSSLTSVVIPDSVTSIGGSAFEDCSSLTSVVIPDSVTTIGYGAFYDCSSLTAIKFEGTVEQWNAITKGTSWKYNVPATEVICSDGTVSLN